DRQGREDDVRGARVHRLPRALPVAPLAGAAPRLRRARPRRDRAPEAAVMAWRDPTALAALALVPLAAAFFWWARRRRARALATFVEAALLPTVAPDLDRRRRLVRAGLAIAGVAALALALAGPMWGFHWEEVRREGIDLVVALDTSKSMLATDVA